MLVGGGKETVYLTFSLQCFDSGAIALSAVLLSLWCLGRKV